MNLWDFMLLGAVMWAIAIGAKQYKDMQLKKEDPEQFRKQRAEEAAAKARREKLAGAGLKGAVKIISTVIKK